MKRKILVTGAGGYIGSIGTKIFLENGYEVVAIDNFSTGFEQPLQFLQKKFGGSKIRYYKADIQSDLYPLFREEKNISCVIHYAGFSSVDESMRNPQKYFINNINGSNNLLRYIVEAGVRNIVFSSSAAVYKKDSIMPFRESGKILPVNPYAETKFQIENTIRWYNKTLGLNYIILRYFNVYGASNDGLLGDGKKPSTALVQNAVKGILKIEPFYLTYLETSTPDGSPIRDYIDVEDLNYAHLKSIDHLLKKRRSEIINLGSGNGNSVLQILSQIEKITGVKIKKIKKSLRKGEQPVATADIRKAKELLNWEPQRNLNDGINSLIKWYKKHPNGWNK